MPLPAWEASSESRQRGRRLTTSTDENRHAAEAGQLPKLLARAGEREGDVEGKDEGEGGGEGRGEEGGRGEEKGVVMV